MYIHVARYREGGGGGRVGMEGRGNEGGEVGGDKRRGRYGLVKRGKMNVKGRRGGGN